eukprot:5267357-Pleurochrysis_carterae.AAC.1
MLFTDLFGAQMWLPSSANSIDAEKGYVLSVQSACMLCVHYCSTTIRLMYDSSKSARWLSTAPIQHFMPANGAERCIDRGRRGRQECSFTNDRLRHTHSKNVWNCKAACAQFWCKCGSCSRLCFEPATCTMTGAACDGWTNVVLVRGRVRTLLCAALAQQESTRSTGADHYLECFAQACTA